LTLAIYGDPAGERWLDFERKAGKTVEDCYQFILAILISIGRGTPLRRRMFTMDNLLAHKNRVVIDLILAWGHRFCFRAPYHPIDGAVDFVFNTVQHDLTIRLEDIKNGDDLRNEVYASIGAIDNFVNYFLNVGM